MRLEKTENALKAALAAAAGVLLVVSVVRTGERWLYDYGAGAPHRRRDNCHAFLRA